MSAILNECSQYRRTQKGNEEVANETYKSYKLSARQRQFLLLIDKTDTLNQQICEQLAHAINIEQLVDLGLLSTAQKVAAAEKNLATAAQNHVLAAEPASMPFEHTAKTSEAAPAEPVVIQLTVGEFSHIKATMVQTLKKTSGLLAADLILKIEKSKNPQQLKKLTAIWRTTLLESKANREQVQQWFNEVNHRLNG